MSPVPDDDQGRPLSHIVITSNRVCYTGPLPTELLDEIAAILARHIAIENITHDPLGGIGFTPEIGPDPTEPHPWEPDTRGQVGGTDDDDSEGWKP